MDKTNIDVINGKGQGVQRHRGKISAEIDVTTDDPMDSKMNLSEIAKMAEEQAADFLSFEFSPGSDDEDRLSLMSFDANEENFEVV